MSDVRKNGRNGIAVRSCVATGVISSLIQTCRNLLRQAPSVRKPVISVVVFRAHFAFFAVTKRDLSVPGGANGIDG